MLAGAMRRVLCFFLCLFLGAAIDARGAPRHAVDQLSIGVTQYPSTLNPLIDEMAAKT
jgi:hypothetical protein